MSDTTAEPKPIEAMSTDEMRDELDERGVEVPQGTTKPGLVALLQVLRAGGFPVVLDAEQSAAVEASRTLPAVRAHEAMVVRGEVSAADVEEQRAKIKQVMEAVMTKGVHYGEIPGVNKPTLLKPGAEVLAVTFRLAPSYQSERIFHDDGHLTVISRARLTHIPSGLVIAEGEGLCSSREKKYAYRGEGRTCPACSTAGTIKKSKFPPRANDYPGANASDPPGWYCHSKAGGCGANFAADDARIVEQTGERVANPDLPDTWNCVTPDTRILTRDLRWVPAGELSSGDLLVGVQEEGHQYGRPYEDGIATLGERFEDELYEVRMEDGRVVRCNGEHRWLVKGTNSGVEWVATETMYEGLNGNGSGGRPRRSWRILSTGVWEHEESAEAGYIAGLLDADGSLDVGGQRSADGYHLVGVSFAQQRGGVLDRLRDGLADRGFQLREYEHGNPRLRAPVVKVNVGGGLFEQMRLLGTVRPPRLLQRWETLVDLRRRRFEGTAAKVLSIARVGRGELVRLGTTSHTYIAEGLVCHNTVLKMADKRALVAAILNGTAASDIFTQDVEDAGPAADDTSSASDAGSSAPAQASAPRAQWVAPSSWGELGERMQAIFGAQEASYWSRQAFEVALGEPEFAAFTDAQKDEAWQMLLRVLRALDTTDGIGDLAFNPDHREIVQRAFAAELDGVAIAGPPWALSSAEAESGMDSREDVLGRSGA